MYQEERRNYILEELYKQKRITVDQICKTLKISKDTARRDLLALEKKALIVRTHGGAILPDKREKVKNYKERRGFLTEAKKKIAEETLKFIENEEKIFIDNSTTVQYVIEMFNTKNIHIVTNSYHILEVAKKNQKIDITMLGGKYNFEQGTFFGEDTLRAIDSHFADIALVGSVGVAKEGLTVATGEDAVIMNAMVKRAQRTILLADSSKLNKISYYKICGLEDIDLLITDKKPEEEFIKILKEKNIELVVAK